MNRRSKIFFIGFGVVMVGGLGVLGYLLSQSVSHFSELSQSYDEQSTELKRLQTLPLYPEQSNLVKLKEVREAAGEAAASLQKQLIPMSIPLETITPEQFQDKLRALVSSITGKAKPLGVKLPKDFYLGFPQYQKSPPKTEAASPLDRQLKAVEIAVNALLEQKVEEIVKIDRTPLPEEVDALKVLPTAPIKPVGLPGKVEAPKPEFFSKFPFEIQFRTDQSRLRRVLNDLAKNEKQFFVIRPITIQNSGDKPLQKVDPLAAAAAAAQVSGTAPGSATSANQPKAQNLRYLVGMEKLNVLLRLEMVVFANTPANKQ